MWTLWIVLNCEATLGEYQLPHLSDREADAPFTPTFGTFALAVQIATDLDKPGFVRICSLCPWAWRTRINRLSRIRGKGRCVLVRAVAPRLQRRFKARRSVSGIPGCEDGNANALPGACKEEARRVAP